MSDKIGIILQARMCSSRLPGKILKKIGEKILLEHIFYRLSFLKSKAKLVLATSNSEPDNLVEELCKNQNIDCFRGSEINVLERYYLCAKEYGFLHIVRMTGDNPFPDIEEIDNLINFHLESKSDYTNSFSALPVGVGAEIFSFSALEKSYYYGKEPNHLEHVNEYITDNPELFDISFLTVPNSKNRPDIRLTVDTNEDYQKACYIVSQAKNDFITTEEAISLCLQYA